VGLTSRGLFEKLPRLYWSRTSSDSYKLTAGTLDVCVASYCWLSLDFWLSEVIALKPEYIHGPNIDVLGFGEVVWSRTCWSMEIGCSMNYTDNIHRGVWAGHHFDITTLDRHKQGSLKGTEWKDVSEEVAYVVERIWRKEFGSNWHDTIQQWRQH